MKVAALAKIITFVPVGIEGKTQDDVINRKNNMQGESTNNKPEFKNIKLDEYENYIDAIYNDDDL